MPKDSLNRANLAAFRERIDKLAADTPRKFGTMDTNAMLRHMRLALETSVGETDLPDKSLPPVVRQLIYFLITNAITTWPGGKLKAPDFWSPPSEHSFEEEKRLFLGATERYLKALEETPEKKERHPIFGSLNLRQWSRLHGLHLNHHLRQFGV